MTAPEPYSTAPPAAPAGVGWPDANGPVPAHPPAAAPATLTADAPDAAGTPAAPAVPADPPATAPPATLAAAEGWSPASTGDTLVMALSGELTLELAGETAALPGPGSADGTVRLGCGDAYVVPPGVAYRATAHGACEYVLIDPAGTTVTGRVDD
ncbi:hypothetical protein [Streptomyces bohaiensis]|uniref:Cupin domain-containing protein n=1 Tax=Streptomyces bohaiensis TaxID=1431344 RepID=A0ABX1CHB2_9ACTN|nr:hypothetical protein [Streptomyces bohaiensis]NJQ17553.1 hypothetical protein [Streptomyces bohaiensis]